MKTDLAKIKFVCPHPDCQRPCPEGKVNPKPDAAPLVQLVRLDGVWILRCYHYWPGGEQ